MGAETQSQSKNAASSARTSTKKSDPKHTLGQAATTPDLQRVIAEPGAALPNDILALQNHAGNHAVQRLLSNQGQGDSSLQRQISTTPTSGGLVQRLQDEADVEGSGLKPILKRAKRFFTWAPDIYKSDEQGNLEEKGRSWRGKTKFVTRSLAATDRMTVVAERTNPHPDLEGDYYVVKIVHFEINQVEDDKVSLTNEFGLVKKDKTKALGTSKDFEDAAVAGSPKSGKILPTAAGDPPISQSDVVQKNISDCYFQAAMISIVKSSPASITGMFTITAGAVTVNFPGFVGATGPVRPGLITLSRNIFFDKAGNPLYGGRKDAYLWPAFLQKAWAVYKGSYAKLPMGTPLEITQAITGRDLDVRRVSARGQGETEVDQSWQMYNSIVAAIRAHRPVMVATGTWTDKVQKGDRTERVRPTIGPTKGSGMMHTYAIFRIKPDDLIRPQDQAQEPRAVVEMRNPRTDSGETFKIPILELTDKRRFNYIAMGR